MVKLDIGCGIRKQEGFIGVDKFPLQGVDVVMDITKDPWPWEPESVDQVHCSHFIEHLTAMERVQFLNNLYRVMKYGAQAQLIAPNWASCRAYGDPTHQWPPIGEMFPFYLNYEWRVTQGNAPHTDASNDPTMYSCDFDVLTGFNLDIGVQPRHDEARAWMMKYYKESTPDIYITLTKTKREKNGN